MKAIEVDTSSPRRSAIVGIAAAGGYLKRSRAAGVLAALCVATAAASVLALAAGSEKIPVGRLIGSVPALLSGSGTGLTAEQEVILFSLRLPRIALAAGVGAALAVAGAAFQALLRNPLGDPYVLGVSGGAALGTILAIVLAPGLSPARPLSGFLGAAAATLVVYAMGRRSEDPARLVLAGIVVSTLLSSIIVLLTAVADNAGLRNITLWLLGDLSSGSMGGVAYIFLAVSAGVAVLLAQARSLNLMMIGERDAFSLGVDTARVRWISFLTASLLTGSAVSAGGAIGYVGLVVPHLVRLSAGTDNRLVIPASALAGALLVILADTAARTALAPRELPTGAITALIGAPVFIYLLLRSRLN